MSFNLIKTQDLMLPVLNFTQLRVLVITGNPFATAGPDHFDVLEQELLLKRPPCRLINLPVEDRLLT